jgi:CelD/BcsL family acetyltransferase involved in cellulose biosynthesis
MASLAGRRPDAAMLAGAPEITPDRRLVRLQIDDPAWSAFAASCVAATPFHHPAWTRLLADTYRYRAFALALPDPVGHLVAGAPFVEIRGLSGRHRWVSLPYTDECPLLAEGPAEEEALVAALGRDCTRLRAPGLEVRAPVHAPAWRTHACAVLHVLDLESDAEAVRGRFSRSRVVRNIRRAERAGVTVRTARGPADLDAFYALHTRTRRRQGVPVQPRRFFELLWERLVERGLGSILLASAAGAPVAGALFLTWNGTTIYKFGASDREGLPLRPNHLLFWTAIRESCERGDRRFDFGRTDLGNAGLRDFKSGWGAIERPLVYSSLDRAAADGREGAGARLLGAAIRRGPGWLCRGAGAVLYRYAGTR